MKAMIRSCAWNVALQAGEGTYVCTPGEPPMPELAELNEQEYRAAVGLSG